MIINYLLYMLGFLIVFNNINVVGEPIVVEPFVIEHPGAMYMTLDVWPLMGNIHEYPIQISLRDTHVKQLHFTIQHPFWDMKSKVKLNNEIVQDYKLQDRSPDQIDVLINLKQSQEIENSNKHIASIVFSGTDGEFLQALQYPHISIREFMLPVRYSPPIYPITLKNVKYVDINQDDKIISEIILSFLIIDNQSRVKVMVSNIESFSCQKEYVLRMVMVNHFPLQIAEPFALIDKEGQGYMYIPFNTIGGESDIYIPTLAKFKLFCNDESIAISDNIYLGWKVFEHIINIDLDSVSNNHNWDMYK